jgi:hypothetical protein
MRNIRVCVSLGCCFFAMAILAGGETQKARPEIPKASLDAGKLKNETRKAGLWEITTTMTWQKSPFMSGTGGGMASNGTHAKQVCLTQQMIDEYGALLPQSRGNCRVANKKMMLGGITADWVCTGNMPGTGALESTWSDLEHAKGKVHFVGIFQSGAETKPVEWTNETTLAFKSEDCGSVRPMALPEPRR